MAQDTNQRQAIKSEKEKEDYIDFITSGLRGQKKTVINYEVTALAYELEILNLLLKGELKSAIARGEPLSPEEICMRLGASSCDFDLMFSTLVFANEYFPEGIKNGRASQRFFDFVVKVFRSMNYDIYARAPDGKIEKYQ